MSNEEENSIPELINDRFRVLRLLGKGGMGQVLLVEDQNRDNAQLALKTLLPQTTDRLLTSGFRDEFAELAKLEHVNLARAYDFGRITETGEYFFTTEFVQGVELLDSVKEANTQQLINITIQTLRALDFIHQNGLLHNDLKPANILITNEETDSPGGIDRLESLVYGHSGTVKLIDFGLISKVNSAWDKILGTPRFISPERILKQAADARSDLYCIGVVFYFLFTKTTPFRAKDPKTLLRQHLQQEPPDPRQIRPDIPEFIAELTLKLLAKNPNDRFSTGAEAIRFIESHSENSRVENDRTTTAWKGGRLTAGALLHRSTEIQRIKDAFTAVESAGRVPHAFALHGTSGSGKTRLVGEIRADVQVANGAFVDLDCDVADQTLQPFLDALLLGLRTSGVSRLEKAEEALEDAKGSDNFASALERVCLWFGQNHPLFIHFDNFHRASAPMRQFAVELMDSADRYSRDERKPCRLLAILSCESSFARDLGISGLPTVTLSRFDETQSRQFLASVFGQDDLPDNLVDRLVRASEGNPRFLLELANQLVDTGIATHTGSSWRFRDGVEEIELPKSFDSLLKDRFRELNPKQLDVLSWIAASGRPLPLSVLKLCVTLTAEQLDQQLSQLIERNFIRSTEVDGAPPSFGLAYASCKKLTLSSLEPDAIARIHQRLAQNTEETFRAWEPYADILAEHWELSGNRAGVLRFASKAADLLEQRGNFESAVDYRQRVADELPDSQLAKKIQSLAKLSESYEFLWNLEACVETLERMRSLGGKLMKPRDQALLLRRQACVELSDHEPGKALALLEQATETIGDSDALSKATIESVTALTLWLSGSHEASASKSEEVEKAISALPEPGDDRSRMLRIGTSNYLGSLYHLTGRLTEAEERFRENLQWLSAIPSQRQAMAATLCSLGGVLLDRGHYEEGKSSLTQALEIGKEIGDRRTLCRARERLGECFFRFGQLSEALRITQIGLQDAEAISNSGAAAAGCRTLARIHWLLGSAATALSTLKRAVALSSEVGDRSGEIEGRLELAAIFAQSDDLESAERELNRANSLIAELPNPAWIAHSKQVSLRLAAERGESALLDIYTPAQKLIEESGYHAQLIDLLFAAAEASTKTQNLQHVHVVIEQIQALSENFTKPDCKLEVSFINGQVALAMGDVSKAVLLFAKVAQKARDCGKLLLANRCDTQVQPRCEETV